MGICRSENEAFALCNVWGGAGGGVGVFGLMVLIYPELYSSSFPSSWASDIQHSTCTVKIVGFDSL